MPLDRSEIDAIRNKADIVDIIGRYLPLEKKRKDYVTVCPFHDDHDPSMRISEDKQIYKCFVCGAGGDVFTFLQKHEGLSFIESVRKVASMVGYTLDLPEAAPRPADPRKELFDILGQFTSYCSYELFSSDGKQALEYLQKRKFTKELIESFQIGYAPQREMVRRFLQARYPDRSVLEQTGLIHAGMEEFRPIFADRVVIPIHDPFGNPVGYTARILPGSQQQAKYINSPASELYDKSKLIFNYHRASKACRKAGRLILCEGAMDVLGLAKAGIMEGIACLGTAMTPAQLALIERCRQPVTVFYDQDAAGQKAAYKFGLLAMQHGIPFSIVKSDLAKDPDEIFIEHGAEALQKAASTTVSFTEFCFDYLQTVYSLDNYGDKKEYAKKMESLIRNNLESFEQKTWFDKLQKLTGFTFQAARTQAKTGRNRKKPHSLPAEQRPILPVNPGRLQAEKMVLWAMLYDRRFLDEFKKEVGFFQDPICTQLFISVNFAYRSVLNIDPVALYSEIEEPEARNLLAELAEWPDHSEALGKYFDNAVKKIKSDILSQQLIAVEQEIRECNDPKKKFELAHRKSQIQQQRLDVFKK